MSDTNFYDIRGEGEPRKTGYLCVLFAWTPKNVYDDYMANGRTDARKYEKLRNYS